jgi:hypothetical protein
MRGKKLQNTRQLIKNILIAHPSWNATEIYNLYVSQVGDPDKAVRLNAVQKQIQKLKGKLADIEHAGLGRPWNFGLLRDPDFISNNPDFHIDSASVSTIVSLEMLAEQKKWLFTARQVYWVNLLHQIMPPSKDKVKQLEIVYGITKLYADFELICLLDGKAFNSIVLDVSLLARQELPPELKDSKIAPDMENPEIIECLKNIRQMINYLKALDTKPEPPEYPYESEMPEELEPVQKGLVKSLKVINEAQKAWVKKEWIRRQDEYKKKIEEWRAINERSNS